MSELQIRALGPADASSLSTLLSADRPAYREHFQGLRADEAELAATIAGAVRDCYWGILVDGQLATLVMLRGLDAGYIAPAFGVYVGERWSGHGLASLALAFAESWCRLAGCPELMLTVHADNEAARRLYEREGFRFAGEHSPRGQRIYRKSLEPA